MPQHSPLCRGLPCLPCQVHRIQCTEWVIHVDSSFLTRCCLFFDAMRCGVFSDCDLNRYTQRFVPPGDVDEILRASSVNGRNNSSADDQETGGPGEQALGTLVSTLVGELVQNESSSSGSGGRRRRGGASDFGGSAAGDMTSLPVLEFNETFCTQMTQQMQQKNKADADGAAQPGAPARPISPRALRLLGTSGDAFPRRWELVSKPHSQSSAATWTPAARQNRVPTLLFGKSPRLTSKSTSRVWKKWQWTVRVTCKQQTTNNSTFADPPQHNARLRSEKWLYHRYNRYPKPT